MPTQPTILIIDNDEGLVRALSVRFEQSDYRCLAAASGAQGLSIFRENDVDLVITDLNMPAGDGVTLITTIRQASDVPVIVITGFRDDFIRELRHAPNVSVLEKPLEWEALLELVEVDLSLVERPASDSAGAASPHVA